MLCYCNNLDIADRSFTSSIGILLWRLNVSTITSYGEITLTDLREPFVVLLSNEVQQFVTDVNRKASVAQSFYTDVKVFQGHIERTDYIIGTITNANNITVAKTSSRITFSVSSGTVIGADSGTFTIPITLDNNTINKTFSWSCGKQGSVGATGKGISSTETLSSIITNRVFKISLLVSLLHPDKITMLIIKAKINVAIFFIKNPPSNQVFHHKHIQLQ